MLLGDEAERLEQWSVLEKHRVLLYAGGWGDQPDDYRIDMLTLDAMYAEEYNALARQAATRR